MTPVTDPSVLAQLNSTPAQPVTDPAILAQLNGTAPPSSQPSILQQLAHESALAGRNLVQGALALPATIADIPVAAYNTGANLIEGQGKGFRLPEQNQALAAALTKMGAPTAQTPLEHIVGGAEQGIGGAVTGLGIGNALADSASPVASAVGKLIAAMPGKAIASGAAAGGASATAQQAGLPWYAQAGVGLAAGMTPYMSPAALASGGQLTPNEQAAMQAGYKLPPATMQNPSLLSKVLGGWSGKIKTQQAASAANQDQTNALAATDLGLPNDTTLDDNVFSSLRANAGQAYEAVRKVASPIIPDDQFRADVNTLGALNSQLAEHFPELVKNDDISSLAENLANKESFPPAAGIDAVTTLRASASKNIQALGDPQKNALGFAQRQAADAIDGLMDRNISASGSPELIKNYQDARTLIAKSYDVQAATNPATGDVSAAKIAQIAQRRPIGGNLQTIADMANAFPKAVQSPAKFGGVEPWSWLDLASAATPVAVGEMSGRLGEGAAIGAAALSRPLARAIALSHPYQNAIANPTPFANSAASMTPAQLAPLVSALSQYGAQQ